MSIRAFFSDLFSEPDDFEGRPYAYLTNQIGHLFLGATAPMYLVALTYFISGQYPDQTPIAINFVISYAIGWELLRQGWRGLDTVMDVSFVAIGACFYLFVEMDIVLYRMLIIYTAAYVALFVTTYRIWRRSK